MTRDLLLYATGTVASGVSHAAPNRSFRWSLDVGSVGVVSSVPGILTIRDVSGKIAAQSTGVGEVGVARSALPGRMLIAAFDGEGVHEQLVVPLVR